jgi:hypothetical protein
MKYCNPRRVFPINTCGCHETSNNKQQWATYASRFLPPLRCQGYFILFIDVHPWSGEQVSETIIISDLHRERANKVFGSDLHHCSLASSSSSSHLIYCFIGRTPRVIAFNVSSVFIQSPSLMNRKSCTVSPFKLSYILNMLICIDMISLDNMLQCLLFITMIDISRTCDSTAILICNALVIFMIYP